MGTVLFGLVLALELQATNFDVGQLIQIFKNISIGRQFILSKKQSDEGKRVQRKLYCVKIVSRYVRFAIYKASLDPFQAICAIQLFNSV